MFKPGEFGSMVVWLVGGGLALGVAIAGLMLPIMGVCHLMGGCS